MFRIYKSLLLKTRSFLDTEHGQAGVRIILKSVLFFIVTAFVLYGFIFLTKGNSGFILFIHILLIFTLFIFSLSYILALFALIFINTNKTFAFLILGFPFIYLIKEFIALIAKSWVINNKSTDNNILIFILSYFLVVVFFYMIQIILEKMLKNIRKTKYAFKLEMNILNSSITKTAVDDRPKNSKYSYILRPCYFKGKVLQTVFIQIAIKNNYNMNIKNLHFFDGYLHHDNRSDIINLNFVTALIKKFNATSKLKEMENERRNTSITLKSKERSFLSGYIPMPTNKKKIKVPLFIYFEDEKKKTNFAKIILKFQVKNGKINKEKIYFLKWDYILLNF